MASGVKELDGRVGVRDMMRFDPFKISVEKNFNPRVAETLRANIDRLKPMIEAAGGVLQPLWVRRDGETCTLIGAPKAKKTPSAWQKFFASEMRSGRTAKEAASNWKASKAAK